MPYAVATFASITIGLSVLTMMFSGIRDRSYVPGAAKPADSLLLAANNAPYHGDIDSLTASEYAQTRLDVSSESPSVNPQGALVALTKSLIRGGMKDDEVVVVADVFGNGLAQIAEVVEPSHDRRAVGALEKALGSDPRSTPFVAADLDKRSDSVRVVLKFQSVDVPTHLRSIKQ